MGWVQTNISSISNLPKFPSFSSNISKARVYPFQLHWRRGYKTIGTYRNILGSLKDECYLWVVCIWWGQWSAPWSQFYIFQTTHSYQTDYCNYESPVPFAGRIWQLGHSTAAGKKSWVPWQTTQLIRWVVHTNCEWSTIKIHCVYIVITIRSFQHGCISRDDPAQILTTKILGSPVFGNVWVTRPIYSPQALGV